ncbi:unnamed protein product [Symbiodinium sp. CCMP2592]|nr:unnamed protein product [Symbiodinium sp. CCMP2592]
MVSVPLLVPVGTTLTERCIADAEVAIAQTPEKFIDTVTSSRLFKLHMAQYFCKLGSLNMTVLELGVHQGYTTLVWANIFQKVIAVDFNEQWLQVASKTTADRPNVVLLHANLMTDSWTIFRNNQVDVVIIDANHDFHYVRSDAYNSLRQLPNLKYMVFHDYGSEDGVRQTVKELSGRRMLQDCQWLGLGRDGTSWPSLTWHRDTDTISPTTTNLSEGVACRSVKVRELRPPFTDLRYYVYRQPVQELCHEGVFRFLPGGQLATDVWRKGSWTYSRDPTGKKGDLLLVNLAHMSSVPLEVLFNEHRTAFLLTDVGGLGATWYGLQENLAISTLMRTNEEF